MQTYGITAEQAGDGSPDVVWLLKEGIGEAHLYAAGDRLDVGVEAFPGQKPNDMVLWIESHRAVIAGDTLVDFGRGLGVNPRWLRPGTTREQVARLASAAHTACGTRAPDARRADRSCRARARAFMRAAAAPLDAATIERVRASFARQGAMGALGAELADVASGRVAIAVPIELRLSQQWFPPCWGRRHCAR